MGKNGNEKNPIDAFVDEVTEAVEHWVNALGSRNKPKTKWGTNKLVRVIARRVWPWRRVVKGRQCLTAIWLVTIGLFVSATLAIGVLLATGSMKVSWPVLIIFFVVGELGAFTAEIKWQLWKLSKINGHVPPEDRRKISEAMQIAEFEDAESKSARAQRSNRGPGAPS